MKRTALLLALLFSVAASAQVKELACTLGGRTVDVRLDEAHGQASFGHRTYEKDGRRWDEPNPMEPATFTSMEVTWGHLVPGGSTPKYKLNRVTGVLSLGIGAYSSYHEDKYQCEVAKQKF